MKKLARTSVRPRTADDSDWPDRIKSAPFWLEICDEMGNGQTHTHFEGHAFPMSKSELGALRDQITAMLG